MSPARILFDPENGSHLALQLAVMLEKSCFRQLGFRAVTCNSTRRSEAPSLGEAREDMIGGWAPNLFIRFEQGGGQSITVFGKGSIAKAAAKALGAKTPSAISKHPDPQPGTELPRNIIAPELDLVIALPRSMEPVTASSPIDHVEEQRAHCDALARSLRPTIDDLQPKPPAVEIAEGAGEKVVAPAVPVASTDEED